MVLPLSKFEQTILSSIALEASEGMTHARWLVDLLFLFEYTRMVTLEGKEFKIRRELSRFGSVLHFLCIPATGPKTQTHER